MTAAGPTGRGDPGRRTGTVVDFDEVVGLGHVEGVGANRGGSDRLRFHCTQIADGSRSIPVGTSVTFVVVPGRGGAWEAADLRPAAPAPS